LPARRRRRAERARARNTMTFSADSDAMLTLNFSGNTTNFNHFGPQAKAINYSGGYKTPGWSW
jgi:hypothetical protein